MRNFDEALNLLTFLSKELVKLEKSRKEILNSNLHPGDKGERGDKLADEIRKKSEERIEVLKNLVLFPPHHGKYAQEVEQFSKETPSNKSVFIMTKYPDGEDIVKDAQLKRIIDSVKDEVTKSGFKPRMAVDKKYHPNLWENVEVYMLACSRGIAIVENKFKPELNPNVAMEWGWMRAMGKPILFLIEKDIKSPPADVMALIQDRFDWDNPEPEVHKAISQELTG